jgi:hypothetical protein
LFCWVRIFEATTGWVDISQSVSRVLAANGRNNNNKNTAMEMVADFPHMVALDASLQVYQGFITVGEQEFPLRIEMPAQNDLASAVFVAAANPNYH